MRRAGLAPIAGHRLLGFIRLVQQPGTIYLAEQTEFDTREEAHLLVVAATARVGAYRSLFWL